MAIRSKPSSPDYRDNFDRIFGPKRPERRLQDSITACRYPGCILQRDHLGAHIIETPHPPAD